MQTRNSHNHRFKELDALRGMAAVMVMLFHFSIGRSLPFHFDYIRLGNTGVDLFFMISGFVIFMSFNHIVKSSQFIFNRFIRLYPTYWTVVTFTFLLIATVSYCTYHNWSNVPFSVYLANMTMFQEYLKVPDLDASYWTMIVEMNFYILMLLLFRFRLFKFITAIGFTICIAMQAIFFFGNAALIQAVINAAPFFIYAPLFFSGVCFYQIHSGRGNKMVNYAGIALLLICQLSAYKYIHNRMFMSQPEYFVMLVVYYLLFMAFVNHKLGFIVCRVTLFFGKISYALYLIHQYLSTVFIIPNLMSLFHFRYIAAAIVAFVVSTLLAALITYCIELPVRRWAFRK